MRFEWDEDKNRRNRTKHKVSFETAQLVFGDPYALSQIDHVVQAEERWQTLGCVGDVMVLLVAHRYRESSEDEVIRIISARKATRHERRIYEEAQQTAG